MHPMRNIILPALLSLCLVGCERSSQCHKWIDQTWSGKPVGGKQAAIYMERVDASQPIPDMVVLSGYNCTHIQGDFFPTNSAANQGSYFTCILQTDLPKQVKVNSEGVCEQDGHYWKPIKGRCYAH